MIPTGRGKRQTTNSRIAEIAVTEMQGIKVECNECKVSTLTLTLNTHHSDTGCTLTFDKYLILFAWLNKPVFVDFAGTNTTTTMSAKGAARTRKREYVRVCERLKSGAMNRQRGDSEGCCVSGCKMAKIQGRRQ